MASVLLASPCGRVSSEWLYPKALETLQMPEVFKKTVVSGDSIYGFVTSYQGTEGLVYNKAMIEEAGMEFTPTEMFLNGIWSYDDF